VTRRGTNRSVILTIRQFMDSIEMTHDELVERAVRWLKGTRRCPVVLSEAGMGLEIPDAIGWEYGGRSILVECKVSRSDFLRDQKKSFRYYSDSGMGSVRYYMVPPNLISVDDVPEKWGLCYVHPKQVRIIKKAEPFLFGGKIGSWRERRLLISQFAKANLSRYELLDRATDMLDRAADILREWPLGHPLRDKAMKCYKDIIALDTSD
jgi:hypothetical protein